MDSPSIRWGCCPDGPGLSTPRPTELLIVDDERQIAELLELSLRQHGFEVTTAGSGPQAFRLVQQGHFDLVVLDVLMAPWDGFETARRLQQLESCPPIVFLSGVSGAVQQQQGLGLGAAYLTKPFRPSQLIEVIRRVLPPD